METLAPATSTDPIILHQESNKLSVMEFLLRAGAVILLLAAAAYGILMFNPSESGAVDTAKTDKSAGVGYAFNDTWNEIQSPAGTGNVFTRCDPLRDQIRMYVSPSGDLVFQGDAACKKS